MSKRVTVIKPLSAARVEQVGRMFHNVSRINEAFLGPLADQATLDINEAYARYTDTVEKYGDDMWMAFPAFVDHVSGLHYVKYDNKTGDVHFLLKKVPS